MGKEKLPIPQKEVRFKYGKTNLGMLIDPPKQTFEVTKERVLQFSNQGGDVILIGGSGHINEEVFQGTVQAAVEAASGLPIIIFPGHINQIPRSNKGITGVLNYQLIIGEEAADFEKALPSQARAYLKKTLKERKIPSISTFYILAGDPNASVSKVSGIRPVDFSLPGEEERVLGEVRKWLEKEIECVFFDAGSHAKSSVSPDVILSARILINEISPHTLLFVGGGIAEPNEAAVYAGVADCISIGTYFERNGVANVDLFLSNLQR